MRLTFLENCGVYLQSGDCGILVDAPNRENTLFDGVPEETMDAMAAGVPPYDTLCGLIFTHKHSDHYDKHRVRRIVDSRGELPVFAPNGATPPAGTVQMGCFTVRYFTVPHSGAEFAEEYHRTLLISDGLQTVYFTGDSVWDAAVHVSVLSGICLSAAVWNPNFISHEEGRTLLRLSPVNFINHIPIVSEDRLGIARKFRASMVRYASELSNVVPVDRLPFSWDLG